MFMSNAEYQQKIEKLNSRYAIKIINSKTRTQANMLELQRLLEIMKYAAERFMEK